MTYNSRILSLAVICFFIASPFTFAQNYEVVNLETLLNSGVSTQKSSIQKSSVQKKSSDTEMDIEEIKAFVYEVKPTVYIQDQEIKKFGEKAPLIAEVSNNSLNLVQTNNSLFEQVEFLKLRLNQASENIQLDISSLQSFQNLKYIYVECSFVCQVSDIQKMFSNTGDKKILYLISQPE